ncbi:hypothetical protein [Phenylobacterium sp.]|uniref:hypothetical protein n=1 Tax=Phenylobacterium sp. TaxID=1871053 RepID=UPI002C420FA8|nr:hypothetical protein [Phenylobacterium sp.]HVI31873.1 hypothetical protein [Phenylobacterium sp.]
MPQERDDKINTEGRKANAAQPLNAADDNAGAERYPPARRDDSVEASGETRSFDPSADAPTPRQGAGDTSPTSANEGRLGPGADPAEGKR